MNKRKSKTKINNSKNIQEKFIDELSRLYSEDLIWILENKGESVFRKVAKFLGLSKKEIDENLKIWMEANE
jgi:hypothetical protein